jgi:putative peptidoglycan lipid II flippase
LYVLAVPLIATIFMHGALTEIDARMAALSLQAFAAGLLPLVLVKVLAPGYFSRQDTKTPFRIAVIAVVVNVVLNLALFRVMGHVGLALATTTAAWVNALLLWRGLIQTDRYRPTRLAGLTALRGVLATMVMVSALVLLLPEPAQWLQASTMERAWWLALAVTGGTLVYGIVLFLAGARPQHLLHRA